ncbi:MAG: hypothetical protein DRJ40_11800 [Thermoprotei archaeon]|nr:MAG: hypothetical protein DRJ40_11800 [Thermoprotei archaeon]
MADIKSEILMLVTGIILLIVGAVAGTVAVATSKYVINALNSTGSVTITSSENFVSTVTNIVGPTFTVVGVALIVSAVVFIIRKLLEAPKEIESYT